jgi:hypothetical protein
MPLYLESIRIKFSSTDTSFATGFSSFFDVLAENQDRTLSLTSSSKGFFPKIQLDFQSGQPHTQVDFVLSDGEIFPVTVENVTGAIRPSPHTYQPVSLESVSQRFLASEIYLVGIDHMGFNLPWFSPGLHPKILELRDKLASRCLYHRYPSGEPWDFILPGDLDEIHNRAAVDYDLVRKPKFELVSFDKASIPLVQLDLGVNTGYPEFQRLFPEALDDSEFKNIWIYLENPYQVDVCLVINEYQAGDWSGFFRGWIL